MSTPPTTRALSTAALLLSLAALGLLAPPAAAHGGRVTTTPPVAVPPTSSPTGSPGFVPRQAGARVGGGLTPAVSRRRRSVTNVRITWADWWNHNRDALLEFRPPLHDERVPATAAGQQSGVPTAGASPVLQEIIPALERATRDKDAEVRASAYLALGKTGRSELAQRVREGLLDKSPKVREAAALGLGMIPSPLAVNALERSIAKRRGRENLRARTFAAVALGFQGSPEAAAALKRILSRKHANVEIPAAAMLGLGELRTPSVRRPLLRALKPKSGFAATIRGFAAIALGKVGVGRHATALVDALDAESAYVRGSAALALGQFRDAPSPEAAELDALRRRLADDATLSARARRILTDRVAKLERAEKHDAGRRARRKAALIKRLYEYASGARSRGDAAGRNFAAISIGRLGGKAAADALVKLLRASKIAELRCFCAVGLGLAARDADRAIADRVRRFLLDRHVESDAASLRGATAIGLGLLGQEDSGPLLLKALERAKDNVVRGHLALACGMVRHEPATERLRRMLKHEPDVSLRRNAALALGLLGDPRAVELLVEVLAKANGRLLHGSAALALGRVGDRRAIKPLIALLHAQKTPALSRAFAAVALGRLAEGRAVSRLAALTRDNNYLIPISALRDVFDIL